MGGGVGDEGKEDPNTAKSGSLSVNDASMAGRCWPNIECWLCSFVIFRGSGPVLLRNPIAL